jgi:ATP/ADP translocase
MLTNSLQNASVISRDHEDLKKAYNLFLFIFAIALIPAFVFWVQRQERLRRPALIPNSLWKNAAFTTTCVAVFFTWAVFNSFQYFSALYFEQVEGVTALQASLRFLPMIFVGAMTNIVCESPCTSRINANQHVNNAQVTGFLVETIDVRHLVSFSAAITVASSLLMALVTPEWGYWKGPFIAMLLSPLHPDGTYPFRNPAMHSTPN